MTSHPAIERSKSQPPANLTTSATLLAKMALQRRRYLAWDAKAERVTNDEEANKLLTYDYRAPWKLA